MFRGGNLSGVGEAKRFFAPPIFPFPNVDVDPGLYEDDDDDENEDDDASDNNVDLFDSHNFYSLEQDLFLVKYRCFQPELKMDEISQRFQKKFGVTREPEQLEQRFQALQSPEFGVLFALYLQAICLNKDAHYASGTYAILSEYQPLLRSTRTSCETKLFQLLYDDEKALHEPNEMINVEITGRNFPKYTRNVSKTQLCRCANTIQQLFRYQDAGVPASRHQAFTLQAAGTRLEKLQLTDAVAFYDSCHVYNHLEQPIFDRLVQFAKDPNLMERLALLRQQLAESSQIKHDSKRHLEDIFETQQRQRVTELEQMRVEELDRMTKQLEKVLEDDIQHIRRMHETLLNHEKAKIDAKYEEQMAMVSEQISEMKHETFELQNTCESNGWNNLERDIMQASLQVERIFGTSDYLVRLLILTEDLDADPLRRALISYLSEKSKFPQFALRREMTSKMIPDTTVLEILKRCPTEDLREIELAGNRFLHHDLVIREIHTRKIAFGRFLSSLTNDKLRAALLYSSSSNKPGSTRLGRASLPREGKIVGITIGSECMQQISAVKDFPEVLEQEFARRRDFSCVKMNSQHLEKQISFSEEDCLLQLEVSHRYCTVLATKERKQGDSGKWMYEATIEVFSGDGESILLGWEVPRGNAASSEESTASTSAAMNASLIGSLSRTASSSSLHTIAVAAGVSSSLSCSSSSLLTSSSTSTSNNTQLASTLVPGLAPSQDGRNFGITWQSDSGLDMGILHANGQSRSGVPCFRAGDVVGCTINQDDAVPHLCFYLNGEQVLPSVAGTTSTLSYSAGIAMQNPPSCLYPALSMYSSKKKPQMRVRFNFRGGFQFPIAGFEPYGAPL